MPSHKKGLTAVLRAMSNADGMLDHADAIGGYASNAEGADPSVAVMVPMLPRLRLLQDISALRIPGVLIIIDLIIQLLQIISNKAKVSTTL